MSNLSASVFVHVPRTGGNYFLSGLYDSVKLNPNARIFGLQPVYDKARIDQVFNDSELNYIFHGHSGLGFHSLYDDADIRYFTILRDPVERTISEFLWLIRKASSVDRVSVRDLAHRWIDSMTCANHQVRFLARPLVNSVREDHAHITMFDHLDGSIRADYTAAIEFINQAVFVGITVMLDEQFHNYNAALGLEHVGTPDFRNENPHGMGQWLCEDKDLVEKIFLKTSFDRSLYRIARNLKAPSTVRTVVANVA